MIQIVGSRLCQWDVGRSVSVSDSKATHVHLANQGDSKAPIIEIKNGEAKIPDYLLQTGKTLHAYAVLDGVTLESKSFAVCKRERPENYVYQDDQRNYIYDLITNAENAAQNANLAAQKANEAAEKLGPVVIPTKVSQLENDSGFLTEVPAPVYLVTINDANKAVESYAERLAAYQSGYVVQCDYLGARLPLKAVVDKDFMFSGTIDGTSYHVVVYYNGSTVISKRSLASEKDIPTKLSELTNDSGFLTEETAPVTSVNGQTGAVTVDIPTKVSQLQNDSGFLTEAPVTTTKVSLTEQPDGSYLSSLTAAEIMADYKANKTVHCYHDKMILPLIYSVITGAVFSGIYDGQIQTVTVNSNKVATVTATPVSSGGGADGLLFDQATGTLYLLQNGQILGNGVQLPAAEGGSTNNAVLTLENTTDWSVKTILIDSACPVSFQWSSIEDGISTGPGTMVVKVGGVIRYSAAVKQGKHALDISQYLSRGENLIHVSVTDFYGNSQTITLGVTVIDPAALISTKLVERTLTGDYTNDRVTKIGPEAFAGLTLGRLSLPNATGNIVASLANLTADEVELAGVTSTSYWMVKGSTIGVLRLPNVTTIATDEDFRAERVERVVFDRLEAWNKSLRGLYLQVVTFDFHNLKSLPNLPSGGLLSNLLIRTPDVCTLGSAPESTTAKLFVPEDLLADYKSNTNWGVMADRIFAIEDITVDGTVTGEPDSKKMEDIGNV